MAGRACLETGERLTAQDQLANGFPGLVDIQPGDGADTGQAQRSCGLPLQCVTELFGAFGGHGRSVTLFFRAIA